MSGTAFFIRIINFSEIISKYLIYTIQNVKQIVSGEQIFPLPKELSTLDQRLVLFQKIKQLFNQKNYDEFYDIFDGSFKVKYTQEDLTNSTNKMHNLSGRLIDAAYSH